MPDPSYNSSSFIPKRGPVKKRRAVRSRRVYVFTIISYVLMLSALLAAAGVFFYEKYSQAQLEAVVAELTTEIASFKEDDLLSVLDFEARLKQAADRLDHSVSLGSVFAALEAATIDTVQIESLTLTRQGDDSLRFTADVMTDSFDSSIFQRGIFEGNETVSDVTITELQASAGTGEDGEQSRPVVIEGDSPITEVHFVADIQVPLTAIPYDPTALITSPQTVPTVVEAPATTTTNQSTI